MRNKDFMINCSILKKLDAVFPCGAVITHMSNNGNTFQCCLIQIESQWFSGVSNFDDTAAVSYDFDGLFQNNCRTCTVDHCCNAFRACVLFYFCNGILCIRSYKMCCSQLFCQTETDFFVFRLSYYNDSSCIYQMCRKNSYPRSGAYP